MLGGVLERIYSQKRMAVKRRIKMIQKGAVIRKAPTKYTAMASLSFTFSRVLFISLLAVGFMSLQAF